ncbi:MULTISPECIES: HlyD family efflux transporter periplasmic adaptor subunit [unclassified Colwellia]|uniref:efflux RND transporter periplasmic adaptor subunit n=1 Tax=unclassified Colwellia TaxID=196834 RepID=UPI0015F585FE|nr:MULTISPECIES: HlyD family efflux transporter periplasmic adaptor subunit [unclassified Colwellia]MBA6363219.1 HlyD family efflux transporter periplasmic adaptor subunit [Colwellia sp. BRX8-8]MBA6350556.1 HlyD family efflux transporter periplasmic adaptor subunit [Colwellia sp. BRX9-1]MBA6355356.1 HlyD family efflux transporter periplasmic adaptor subunit [Colwellia sp. BRX8-3]MBA6358702.1 HlyD family efflux transporter periplasmic adaptor subunit [Colwellia sp. BRX8-6]MBA6367323.1 HlyD fami
MNKYFAIMLLVLLCACEKAPSETVKLEQVRLIVTASGELESKQTAMIAPPSVSGMWQYQIKQLTPENTRVKKGEVIVAFDSKKVVDRLVDKQADLDRAQKELENKKIKEEESEQELILSIAEKQMEYEKAERKADIIDNSRAENDRKKSVIDFTIAENDLFLAKERLTFHKNNKALNLKLAKGKVNRLTAEVNDFKSDIERLKVKAPIDGMVIYRANWQGEKPAVGESIQFGQPVVELAVIEQMQLKAQIAEPDSGKIKLNQKVKIMIDGTQEIVLQGSIVELGRVFRDKSSQDKRRVFDAIIAFEQPKDTVIRPGMTARIEVVTAMIDNALTLPSQAVKLENGQGSVRITGLFSDHEETIEVAHIVGDKVVIKSGLSQGDIVAL